jgi:hypothetical protein
MTVDTIGIPLSVSIRVPGVNEKSFLNRSLCPSIVVSAHVA